MSRTLLSITLLLLTTAAASSAPAAARRIGWWWDAPSSADDPAVAALLSFCKTHKTIVSSILMQCGPTTQSGSIQGKLSPACTKVIPALSQLGIGSELWLGETDSVAAAVKLLNNAPTAITALKELGAAQPGITGYNFDFEVASATECGSGVDCTELYATFLQSVKEGMVNSQSAPRITTDVSCSQAGSGWAPIISNCSRLAGSVDRLMNMKTYNAGSYSGWLSQLSPALDAGVPRDKLGAGLGCWVDSTTNNTWSTTAESAELRVCALMNASVPEIDMFRVAPEENWPEEFWVAQLERYMAGGGCDMPPLPKSHCPADGWVDGGSCCTLTYGGENKTNCEPKQTAEECAKWQCEESTTSINKWKPLNYSHNPYTCCSVITASPYIAMAKKPSRIPKL